MALLDNGAGGDAAGPLTAYATSDIQTPPLHVTPWPALQALSLTPVDPPSPPPSPIHISGVLMYRLFTDPYPPVAGGANLNALTPTPAFPTINDGILETATTWTFSPTLSLFADLTLENTTGANFSPSDIEETYLDAHNLFGVSGLGVRLGRDRVKLGITGLLLDENVFDGGRRDGFEARATQIGPLSVLGFMQYSLDDGLQLFNWQSSRRVWGGSVAAQVVPGWTVAVAYRTDTADASEVGPCPGQGCNVGSGWSVGFEGTLTPAVTLSAEVASYTQQGDVARWYFQPTVALDLQQLLGLPGQPVLSFWYKNFDPYTAPLDAPLGHMLLPGDFSAFNTNDNLTAVGGKLNVTVTSALSVFLTAEWGAYKNGGPNYNVYSIGAAYSITTDTLIKASYNSYLVDGGVVTTSPVSGLQLSNAQIVLVELTKTF
ncbi:MAG TPA: hypothetical protein VKW09_09320 [bacterium]|nr:hypothetical protein [bacterium]